MAAYQGADSRWGPRILFVGDDFYGSNATSLRDGLIRAGADVTTVNTYPWASPYRHPSRRLVKKVLPGPYRQRVSRLFLRESELHGLRLNEFDALIVFKGNFVSRKLLERFPGVKVHYHPDDSANPANTSPMYRDAERLYDVHLTTKLHNVPELRARTSARVEYLRCAFDDRWHRRTWSRFTGGVGFIGTRRPDREQLLVRLAREINVGPLVVAGSGWEDMPELAASAELMQPQFGRSFSRLVARAPIQIGALNSENRDTHTCRTFEVPAAGGVFVGERTREHEEIFVDGVDAFLYSDADEALSHVSYLQANDIFAERMALAGRASVAISANNYVSRAKTILSFVR